MNRRRLLTLARNTLGAAALVGLAALVGAIFLFRGGSTKAVDAFGCPHGRSCFYNTSYEIGWNWQASNCGFFNLGTMGLGDTISSVDNVSGGKTIQAYEWGTTAKGPGWIEVGPVISPGQYFTYTGSSDNVIDAVRVNC